jgi:hypothetical protein
MYPRFIDIARNAMRNHLQQQERDLGCPQSEVCLTDIMKYHKRAAGLFTDDAPLSVDNLYKGWTAAQRQQKRDALAATAAHAKVTVRDADLREINKARLLRGLKNSAGHCIVM